MRKARVRIEVKSSSHASRDEKMRNLLDAQRKFKRKCNSYGIPKMYKEHEFFVRKTDKNRKKRLQKILGQKNAEKNNFDTFEEHQN
jgi:ribosomal protein S21